jgi:large subunit ribosomal protein L6
MSKIGLKPISFPTGTNVSLTDGIVAVKGNLGEVEIKTFPQLVVKIIDNQVLITRESEDKKIRSQHGLIRMLIANAVTGVNKLWEKTLEIQGVGYRVELQGTNLAFKLGFSHPVIFAIPKYVNAQVKGNKITISGVDKQKVGEVAAEIKRLKKPDRYKGKGIRYEGEVIKLKPGKKAKAGA